jgi:Coenzyme PQQ synthesis protein D (PqqD)
VEDQVTLDGIYGPSDDIVAREIEGEVVIIPLVSGIGDMEDELFTLNETGRAVWRKLDGTRTLRDVARELAEEFEAPAGVIESEVVGLVADLAVRRMVARKG